MKYVHLFDTNSEFVSAYTGEDYLSPWVSLTDATGEVNYDKVPTGFTIFADAEIDNRAFHLTPTINGDFFAGSVGSQYSSWTMYSTFIEERTIISINPYGGNNLLVESPEGGGQETYYEIPELGTSGYSFWLTENTGKYAYTDPVPVVGGKMYNLCKYAGEPGTGSTNTLWVLFEEAPGPGRSCIFKYADHMDQSPLQGTFNSFTYPPYTPAN